MGVVGVLSCCSVGLVGGPRLISPGTLRPIVLQDTAELAAISDGAVHSGTVVVVTDRTINSRPSTVALF